jgi:hypothetical protein
MSSIHSQIAQIPTSAPYYLVLPGALVGGANANVNTYSELAPGNFTFTPLTGDLLTTLSNGNCLLRDMGKTVISANRTFRKVQYLSSGMTSTEGTIGVEPTYATVYVELGLPTFLGGTSLGPVSGLIRYG